jgi:RNA polymerase sigma-70 factor (ECF subfamily)
MSGTTLSSYGEEILEAPAGQHLLQRPSLEEETDAALARRSRQGDMEAFGSLVTMYERRIYALVARILGATATADDIDDTVQDIFVQAWRALPRFRGDSRFSTWLYRIATNMAIKQWHRRKRHRLVVAEEDLSEFERGRLSDPAQSPADRAELLAQNKALMDAVDRLPDKHRSVVLLHYFEDYSCEEIAAILECSVGTVWSRLHYACRKLKGSLDWPGIAS